jgi:ATP-dependent RNA helicase RhlE
MLFSATMPSEIVKVAANYMKLPVRIEVAPPGTTASDVSQEIFFVESRNKTHLLETLLSEYKGSVLVFTKTKFGAKRLVREIRRSGQRAVDLHSDRSLAQRRDALEGFKLGKYRVLIATDIAARGIDVDGITHVVNYELPNVPEDYVHRIGRTGRAGATGIAVSLVAPDETGLMRDIEKVLRKQIPQLPLPHFTRAQPQPQRAAAPAQHADSRYSQPRHAQSKHAQPKHGQPKQSQGKPPNRRRRWQSRSRPQASAR